MDISIPLTVAIGLAGSIAGGGAVFAVMRYRLSAAEDDIKENAKQAAEAKALAVKALGELADFKIYAAGRFVTSEMLTQVEERVVGAINRIGERLDKFFLARGHD